MTPAEWFQPPQTTNAWFQLQAQVHEWFTPGSLKIVYLSYLVTGGKTFTTTDGKIYQVRK